MSSNSSNSSSNSSLQLMLSFLQLEVGSKWRLSQCGLLKMVFSKI